MDQRLITPQDVTIIIPVWAPSSEYHPWIIECIESAIIQGANVHLHLNGVDKAFGAALRSKYNKLSVSEGFGSQGSGAAIARNYAVALGVPMGGFILPLDCDDMLVPGAVEKMVQYWNKYHVPVYPDIEKFGDENVAHYNLLDFSCEHVRNLVGFTSVNVLHPKEYWLDVGGWDPEIEFYEDGEYNARLFLAFCGVHCPEPLVRYRMHGLQRTKQYNRVASDYANSIITKVRSYDMACASCPGSKRVTANANPASATLVIKDVPIDVPLEVEGRVLAQYIGQPGAGSHYYRGLGTDYKYKVQYGDYLYAYPSDVKEKGDQLSMSLLVKYVRPATVATTPESTVVTPAVETKVDGVKVTTKRSNKS